MSDTVKRSPRMHGLPPRLPGSIVMRSVQDMGNETTPVRRFRKRAGTGPLTRPDRHYSRGRSSSTSRAARPSPFLAWRQAASKARCSASLNELSQSSMTSPEPKFKARGRGARPASRRGDRPVDGRSRSLWARGAGRRGHRTTRTPLSSRTTTGRRAARRIPGVPRRPRCRARRGARADGTLGGRRRCRSLQSVGRALIASGTRKSRLPGPRSQPSNPDSVSGSGAWAPVQVRSASAAQTRLGRAQSGTPSRSSNLMGREMNSDARTGKL